ncbi:hypothetical protein B0I35DRAFT_263483 [Stachybotrys elegans]|uniref:Uncharacterized protein n=1 Tax=Stachybotrys elegans TaxID=80388 RepID=A0A8K0STM1_9HYPO|nr:hypothetical protein B0I35DRAFT_263483 [Stachybotrys elegans]
MGRTRQGSMDFPFAIQKGSLSGRQLTSKCMYVYGRTYLNVTAKYSMMDRSGEESEHFLPHGDNDKRPCKCRHRKTLLYHATFFLLYVCFTIIVLVTYPLFNKGSAPLNTIVFSGERLALRQQRFVLSGESPYAGPPSQAIDQAWADLLHHVNIRVSDRELTSSNQSSVGLPTGDHDSLAWMDVSHQLHCVVSNPQRHTQGSKDKGGDLCTSSSDLLPQKYLRQWIYREYYHPGVGPDEEPHWLLHTDHCLDLLRQALMCRADTALMTFHWAAGRKEPMLNLESPEHVCVDWDDLMEKVSTRRISDADMAVLVNPSLGSDTTM